MPRALSPRPSKFQSAWAALQANWQLYGYEAAELAAFMVSACVFTVLLFDPAVTAIKGPWLARGLMGVAMGATAISIIKSPWGKRSGAHFNPAISLTFYRLGKIGPYDTLFYVAAQFVGGIGGVGVSILLLGRRLAVPQVNYAVTVPGLGGWLAAFAAETFMAALLMGVVLITSNQPRLARFTPWCVGVLIAHYVLFLAPVSGFSINPARTLGSAVFAHVFTGLWIYFTAPLLGMMAAAETYVRLGGPHVTEEGTGQYFTHRHLIQRRVRKPFR